MVPFAVYHMERTLNLWPDKDPGNFVGFTQWVRPGWVAMEIAAVAVGVAYLYAVRFPFLLFPVSFCLWYLSMDLTPLWPGFDRLPYREARLLRVRVSVAMGILMMLLGYAQEASLGSDPDVGFWLYFFGLLTFFVAVFLHHPTSDVGGSLYLLVSMCLVLIGSRLERTTFQVFGTLGVVEYTGSLVSVVIEPPRSLGLWLLKALVGVALLSEAVRGGGSIEVLGGVVCVLAFDFNYVSFVALGEVYAVVLLATSLGFVGISALLSRPLNLWVFALPDAEVVFALVSSLTVLLFHARPAVKYAAKSDHAPSAHAYLLYRALASVGISFAMVFLRQPHFAWVGGTGLLVVACCYELSAEKVTRGQIGYSLVAFSTCLLSVVFSLSLRSNLLYLASCLSLLVVTLRMIDGRRGRRIVGCVCAVILVLSSVPLNSKFLISIGAISVIIYLVSLASDTFRNSLMFPLVLIILGLGMIGAAILYQRFEAAVQEAFHATVPESLVSLSSASVLNFWEEGSATDWSSYLSETEFSLANFVSFPPRWVLWPGALTFALIQAPPSYRVFMSATAVLLMVAMVTIVSVRESMIKPLDGQVKVSI